MISVYFQSKKLHELSQYRGIGIYTKTLLSELKIFHKDVQLVDEKEKNNADIIHYPFFDLFFHTLPLCTKNNTVVTIHDVIPLLFPKEYKPGVRGTIAFFLQRLALQKCNAILTDSQNSKKDIHHYLQIPKEKISVLYLAGNPAIRQQPATIVKKVLEKYFIKHPYILYVGDINYNKNLPGFIQACSLLPKEIHVVMIGRTLKNREIPEGETLWKTICDFSMQNRTHLLTKISSSLSQEISALITGAKVYVQPSLYEGFGLPILEAMQCGTVVVCSNTSSLPEVAGDSAFYFDPYNLEEMAESIQKALNLSSQELLEKKARMKQHLKQFSWKKTANKVIQIYKKVAQES